MGKMPRQISEENLATEEDARSVGKAREIQRVSVGKEGEQGPTTIAFYIFTNNRHQSIYVKGVESALLCWPSHPN